MNIPLVDLKKQYEFLSKDIDHSIKDVCQSASFIKGPQLEKFEKNFAKFIGTKYCIGVASGTDALYIALRALRIGTGDEVILPVNTFIATAYAVLYTGAKPVLVDIDPKTYNINPELIESKITKKTKVIIPVHLYGQPAQMDKILNIAKKYKLYCLEDACQSHGASFKNKKTGTFGQISAFSFYPGKNLGAYGDGGAITTNSPNLAKIVYRLREYGSKTKYKHEHIGYNSRLDGIQAAILDVKLKHLNEWNENRRGLADYYTKRLNEALPFIITPFIKNNSTSVFHLYVIRTPRRSGLTKHLLLKGIQTGIHYPIPLYKQKSLEFLNYRDTDFPVVNSQSKEILSLPLYPELTQNQQDYIIDSMKSFFRN